MLLLNDFIAQWLDIKDDVLAAVDRVGRSGWLILGDEVRNFEAALTEFWGLPFAVGVANGLDAIEISLRTLRIRAGDKVLTTPLSAFATSLAIVRAGGVPVFVDTDHRGLIDLELADQLLSQDPSIKFMVPVHLYGHSLDLIELKRLKDKFDLSIVEDCAQSIGARSHGAVVGSVGQMAATSFYPTKNLGCFGDGGAILTSSEIFANESRALRDYGQSKKYVHDVLGLNSRLDELQAAIMMSALLPRLEKATFRRKEIARRFTEEINNPRLRPICAPVHSDSVWHLFPIVVDGERSKFQEHLKVRGISSAVHYPILIPEQKAMEQFSISRSFPVAEKISLNEVSIPIHPYLSESDLDTIIDSCNRW